MQVEVAGYNVDKETLDELLAALERIRGLAQDSLDAPTRGTLVQIMDLAAEVLARDNLTPETLSAAYARISRDPRTITELRAEARHEVAAARRSNRSIIFSMGHASIAEHAVFNLDLIGLSRLLLEELESHRLVSFTEKSQRYVKLEQDFIIPKEIASTEAHDLFLTTVLYQAQTYELFFRQLLDYFENSLTDGEPEHRRKLALAFAKEDARYVSCLATATQVGMTTNARNLELIIRRLRANPLAEAGDLAKKLYDEIAPLAPSLLRYVEPTPQEKYASKELIRFFESYQADSRSVGLHKADSTSVRLILVTPRPDEFIPAATLMRTTGHSCAQFMNQNSGVDQTWLKTYYLNVFKHLRKHEVPIREFEFPEMVFELIVSASCFAQLKRHRMLSLVAGPYNPALGYTIPNSIVVAGLGAKFEAVMERTNAAYRKLAKEFPDAAPYLLTNAHRRRVLLKLNLRELYHFCGLREDHHAQWDIRNVANAIGDLARSLIPFPTMLLGGKDEFSGLRDSLYGR